MKFAVSADFGSWLLNDLREIDGAFQRLIEARRTPADQLGEFAKECGSRLMEARAERNLWLVP